MARYLCLEVVDVAAFDDSTPEEDITFHDQVGYWLWGPATGLVLQTVAIARGKVAIASGEAHPEDDRLVPTAERGQTEYGICSTAFLEYAFRTDRYKIEVKFDPDGTELRNRDDPHRSGAG